MFNNIIDTWNLQRQIGTNTRSSDHVWFTRMFNGRKLLQLVRPEDSLQLSDRNGHGGR